MALRASATGTNIIYRILPGSEMLELVMRFDQPVIGYHGNSRWHPGNWPEGFRVEVSGLYSSGPVSCSDG
ncbi:Hypothetical predicted protein, partial [Mytilus galloprovincialis]